MRSIFFLSFFALAAIGCDTPENTTGTDTMIPTVTTDSTIAVSSDTTMAMSMDTTGMPAVPADTTTK